MKPVKFKVHTFDNSFKYIKPKSCKPLKLVVHATPTFDRLCISEKGIRSTLRMQPDKFNVLELLNPAEFAPTSYSGLHKNNMLYDGPEGFIFDPVILMKNEVYFKNVDTFLLMGGAIESCIKRTFRSIIALKTCHLGTEAIGLFKNDGNYNAFVDHHWLDVQKLGFNDQNIFNIHFIKGTLYPHNDNLAFYDGRIMYARRQEGSSLRAEFALNSPEFRNKISNKIFNTLSVKYGTGLDLLNINVHEHMDGKVFSKPIAKTGLDELRMNLFYWSSTEKMDKYFAKENVTDE